MSAVFFIFILMNLSAGPVFQPMVKEYHPEKGIFSTRGLTVFYEDNRQCEIGASEISTGKKIKTDNPEKIENGIFIYTLQSQTGRKLADYFRMNVPAKKQGYAIRVKDGCIAVIGNDPIGALYGAITLRQMILGEQIQNASVSDYPDILYRGSMSFSRGIGNLANQEKNPEAAYKAGIDYMLRHKLNILCDYFGVDVNSSKKVLDFTRRVNEYARERGIYPNLYPTTALFTLETKPKGMTPAKWHCISDFRGNWCEVYCCWGYDQKTRAAAERYASFLEKIDGAGILVIHPIDGGGVNDPEMWSKRCETCRSRWKDDERWKASVNQLTIWSEVFRKHFPEALVGSPVYPYQVGLLATPKEKQDDAFRRNVLEYWHNLSEGLKDKSFFFSSWMPAPELIVPYRKFIGNRKMHFSDPYPTSSGIFATYHRYAGSIYEPDSENIFSCQGTDSFGQWESLCLVAEHTWNLNAPGSEKYIGGMYYDALNDHTGPRIIMTETLPRICETFWGKALAPYMTKVMSSGIMPRYITDPVGTLRYLNSMRINPLHDPNVKEASETTKKLLGNAKYKPINDDTAMMERQVKAAELIVSELEKARPHIDAVDKYKRKYFMYYAKTAPYWLAIARAHYNVRRGNDLVTAGRNDEALAVFESGRQQLETDYTAADANAATLKNEIALQWGHEKLPAKETLQKAFENAILSAKVTLQPRRIGRFIKVGITNGMAAKGIKEYLDDFENVKATVIDGISLVELDKYDCVFVTDHAYDKGDLFKNIKAYVDKGGGGVVFEGSLCGHPRFTNETPFPQIVKNAPERKDHFTREALWLDNSRDKLMYVDYFTLVPGEKGKIIAWVPDGTPLAVQGASGLGKVIFIGSTAIEGENNTYNVKKSKLFGLNARLAKYAVEYFTGMKLEKKK